MSKYVNKLRKQTDQNKLTEEAQPEDPQPEKKSAFTDKFTKKLSNQDYYKTNDTGAYKGMSNAQVTAAYKELQLRYAKNNPGGGSRKHVSSKKYRIRKNKRKITRKNNRKHRKK
jgi:hypothetical protein